MCFPRLNMASYQAYFLGGVVMLISFFIPGGAAKSGWTSYSPLATVADMSHRLTEDAPAGYSPQGKVFDEKLVGLVKNYDVEGIMNFDPDLAEEAGQDALWSIAILLGALEGKKVKPEVLSYEGPFGVGYMIAALEVEG